MPAAVLRDLRAADRAPIGELLRATGAFPDAEIAVALELVDEALADAVRAPDRYRFLVAEVESGVASAPRLAGYVCWGLVPLSDGVFDVYWIAVDPRLHGRGLGRALLRAAEDDAAREGGRMVLIETGGKASYAPTRAFYERAGYAEIARIPDFFRVGDDKVIYARRVGAGREAARGRAAASRRSRSRRPSRSRTSRAPASTASIRPAAGSAA
jgi:ribosomal protein S18 acetylase RimI-like enzyme